MTREKAIQFIASYSKVPEFEVAAIWNAIVGMEAEAVQLRRGDNFVGYAEVSPIPALVQDGMERAIYLDAKAAGDVE